MLALRHHWSFPDGLFSPAPKQSPGSSVGPAPSLTARLTSRKTKKTTTLRCSPLFPSTNSPSSLPSPPTAGSSIQAQQRIFATIVKSRRTSNLATPRCRASEHASKPPHAGPSISSPPPPPPRARPTSLSPTHRPSPASLLSTSHLRAARPEPVLRERAQRPIQGPHDLGRWFPRTPACHIHIRFIRLFRTQTDQSTSRPPTCDGPPPSPRWQIRAHRHNP